MATPLQFLNVDDVLEIHDDTILHEGGSAGVRDTALLESAVMMPQQQFAGVYLHEGIVAMAAAYLFHIVSAHAFVDGNKRSGALAALVFLDLNGHGNLPASDKLERATIAVASGEMGKDELTKWMRREVGD